MAPCLPTKDNRCPVSIHQRRQMPTVYPPKTTDAPCLSTKDDICPLSIHQRRQMPHVYPPKTTYAHCLSTKDDMCPLSFYQRRQMPRVYLPKTTDAHCLFISSFKSSLKTVLSLKEPFPRSHCPDYGTISETETERVSNSKHWFTTSFLQPLPYLVTP